MALVGISSDGLDVARALSVKSWGAQSCLGELDGRDQAKALVAGKPLQRADEFLTFFEATLRT